MEADMRRKRFHCYSVSAVWNRVLRAGRLSPKRI